MYSFTRGATYTRKQIFRTVGIADPEGGDWYTGYTKHAEAFFIFCGIESAGRTGHDYGNRFVGEHLVWRGKTNSHVNQPRIQEMLEPGRDVYIFYRHTDREPFTFAGLARAVEVLDVKPVQITWAFD